MVSAVDSSYNSKMDNSSDGPDLCFAVTPLEFTGLCSHSTLMNAVTRRRTDWPRGVTPSMIRRTRRPRDQPGLATVHDSHYMHARNYRRAVSGAVISLCADRVGQRHYQMNCHDELSTCHVIRGSQFLMGSRSSTAASALIVATSIY